MTAPTAYTTLDSDDLGANKILRAATMSALDSNPVSIAQRGTGAPWLNGVGAIATLTSGSGNWTVPAGVYRIKVTAVGGGGGNSGSGGTTTFSTITANGGASNATGGTATGGDINISGGSGEVFTVTSFIGFPMSVVGGYSAVGGDCGKGANDSGTANPTLTLYGGGGGGTSVKVFSVEPSDLMAYAVGGGGSGGGKAGIIIIEY